MGVSFRGATLAERRQFYRDQFSLGNVKRWFHRYGLSLPEICALDAGSETKILKNIAWNRTLFYISFEELAEKIQHYLPEDLYYDRTIYECPAEALKTLKFPLPKIQELVFDVDANNISCNHFEDACVCYRCLSQAYHSALALNTALHQWFRKTTIVYSGRGFHVHVLDKKAFKLSIKEREQLNKKLGRFPIDPWVSRGYIRLIRLPYSLNGAVSRIATPLSARTSFDEKKTIPHFLT